MSGTFTHDGTTDRELRLADGRRVTYSELGAPDGAPVLSCHGGLVCRFDVEPNANEFHDLRARVISPDRPGVGGSDRRPGHSTADWVDDARELLDALGIKRCAVMGWSLGGQYAAAVGARLGDRVTRVAVIAGAPPLDEHDRFAQLNRLDRRLATLSRRAAPVARVAFTLSARVGRRSPLRLAKFEAKHMPASDAAVVREHGAWLGLAMGEGGRNGAGMVDEYRAFVGPWGFRLGDIEVPTHVYQGLADTLVPPAWAKELASGITGAELTEYDGEGHMIALSHRAEVVRALVASG
jgi:pimeloyl-ACP methyl ester carboxylesterase